MVKTKLHIIRIFTLLLLLLTGMGNEAWAAYKVTYHILTLPMTSTRPGNTDPTYYGWRTEAIKVEVASASTIQLEAHFKSPLAKNFTYYPESVIKKDGTARQIYQYRSANTYRLYKAPLAPYVKVTVSGGAITNEVISNDTEWDAAGESKKTATSVEDMETQVSSFANGDYYFSFQAVCKTEGDAIPSNDYHVYVTYEYDAENNLAKLDGSVAYNVVLDDKFLAFNRGRNNRMAVIPKANVSAEQLTSDDFVYVNVLNVDVLKNKTYWNDKTNNPNPASETQSKFFFLFKYKGEDPYNIAICSAYEGEKYYIEKYADEGSFLKKYYKESSLFAKKTDEMLFASDDHKKYTQTDVNNSSAPVTYDAAATYNGYYHGIGPANIIWNSFAMLNAVDNNGNVIADKTVFMASRTIKSDGDLEVQSGKFYYLGYDNPATVKIKPFAKQSAPAADEEMYEIYEYTFKVKTPFGTVITATKKWTEAYKSYSLIDHVPDELLRKYVSFTKAYTSDNPATRSEISTFAESDAADNGRIIWLEYTTSMPFETLPVGGCYNDARYYTIRANGASQAQNLGYYSSGSFYTGLGSNTVLHQGENSAEAQFAFIGDPYELKIISRAASEATTASGTPAASHNRYVGCATAALDGTTLTAQTGTNDISTWQIEPGNITNPDYFVLRQFNTEGKYIGWNSGAANKPMTYSSTSTTIRVVELEKKAFVYHIVRGDGSIAVKAIEEQDIGTPLRKKDVPDIIHSPFIDFPVATITFYSDAACNSVIKHAPYTVTDENKHIYVKYDMNDAAAPYLDNKVYHVMLNGEYIYYDNGIIKSKEVISDDEAASGAFKWKLGGNDPYAMTIQTMDENVANYLHYVEVTNWVTGTISNPWPSSVPDSKFIVKLSPYTTATTNVYEVMAATGDGTDASETYYNIGRLDNTTVKMVDNTSSAHGSLTLRFRLFPTESTTHNVTYHLIDNEGVDLLQTVARHTSEEAPDFPAQYRSPLVTNYHYYVLSNFTTNTVSGVTHYTLDGSPSELTTIGDETDVYVLYNGTNDVSNQYDMQNKRITYLLKYKSGTPFRAEDGSDGLETTPVTPIYPYCNGDCCFFVYGQDQFDLQQEGAASTRTRWAWYLESTNNDPYHVKICSRQQETYNQDDIRGYFATYQPDDYDKVVTTLVWPTISGIQGADYMILGTTGNFRLVTTNEIPLDSDHNGTPESTQRYTVKSFEQYWKTFDTVKKKILDGELDILEDKDKGNSKYEDPDGSILVPTSPASYRESLTGEYNFHSYKKWAYAKRFNGYNKEGKTSKGWEEIEHWFQTVDMGEGYFSLEEVDINPVMILLDQHGWEIMRKPLPTSPTDPTKAAKYNQIRLYDSPMVEKYYFWTKASKRSGFHQYYNLSQQVMVDGEPYTSTTLTELPPYDTATNLRDAKGNQYDEYVTYTVKDEYVQSFKLNYSYTENMTDPADNTKTYTKVSVTGEGAPFLIQQGSHFASATSAEATSVTQNDVPATGGMQQYIVTNISDLAAGEAKQNELWYVMPNLNIDKEMGYDGYAHEWANDYERKDKVQKSGFNSWAFDPYNIQISSVPYSARYLVTNATGATLSEGAGSLIGTYENDPAVNIGAQATEVTCSWYDSRALDITNATFMVVSHKIDDEHTYMQLMPRFDHTTRMKDFSSLVPTTDPGIANTYTELYRPLVYNYHILDNEGNESLRYRSGGDLAPQTPDHFKSPLAKDFKYYSDKKAYSTIACTEDDWDEATGVYQKTATSDTDMKSQTEGLTTSGDYYFKVEYYKKVQVTTAKTEGKDAVFTVDDATSSGWTSAESGHQKTAESDADMNTQSKALAATGDYYFKITYYRKVTFNANTTSTSDGIYSDVRDKKDISSREITESFASSGQTTAGSTGNDIYVRYSYDEEADVHDVLKGKWLTMKLNEKDTHYDGGIKQGTRPVDGEYNPISIDSNYKEWQWKFLKTPQSDPDPYAVQLFNRNNPGSNNELPTSGKYFALLSHTSDGFALAEARTENANYDTYNFLNGNGEMSASNPATIARESGFLSTSCSFSGTNSQLNLFDEVEHTYNYKIYTNSGAFAISATQDNETIVNNEYVPVLPENIKSPLLNWDQFRYYNKEDVTFADGGLQIVDAEYPTDKPLSNLYGLYDDEVVVHYTAYDPLVTEYKVPNERNATNTGQVERASTSNDASIEINDDLLYNIIWHSDNMMVGSGDAITDGKNQEISGTPAGKVWRFAGNDPYAIKIRQNGAEKYVYSSDGTTCNLSGTGTTFMLLPRDDNYEYGMFQVTGGTQKLTGFGSTLTTGDAVPTKFIIFALSTHKVTYHLVIANIGNTVNVYYPDKDHTIEIKGTTQRDLTANAIADHAVGHVSLGDPLKVPEEMYRPNVDFFFYVGDIKDVNNDGTDGALNESLTNLYKGHLITAMGKDPNLVGKHVYINIVYSFQGGLPTNAGDGFVLSVDQNKWYTFEAQKRDGTPQLMQFTNAWGMEVKEGRGTHYTNDYLWTPIGDPYGFKMYHRYTCVNSGNDNTGEPNRVMTTAGFSDNEEVWMDDASGTGANKISSQGSTDEEKEAAKAAAVTNSVYELLADKATESSPGTTPGYFKIHPVANSDGTQYYFKIVRAHENPLDDSTPEHDYVRLSSDDDYTEFTFGLSEDLVRPYYDRHGYVGGLKDDEYNTENADKKAIVDALKAGKSLTSAQLMTAQSVVYNSDNIVKYSPGYYRLHSPEDIEGVTVRYASGYTHKKELTGGEGNTPIPMHFYERKGVNTTFEILGSGFTRSDATRGAIPISEPAYDPASIFYFYEGDAETPMSRIQTQGLYLKGVKGPVNVESPDPSSDLNNEATNERAAAVMTATSGEAQQLYIMDIGGGILLIHDNVTALGRQYLKYLSFDQNDPDHIYDLKLTHNTHTDYAKWLMEPANAQGLTLAAHSGFNASIYGATYYHTTFCAPFDVLVSGDKGKAYTCVAADSPWPDTTTGDLHPKPIGEYNTGTYASNNNFVPAGTPVLIASTDNSGTVKLTIPTTSPSTPISTIFSGKYLEQKLDGTNKVYTFGLPFTSNLTMDNETGDITGTLPQQAETGVGFYINANPNKELGLARAEWIRNNRYVIHNKIYYRSESSGASAPEMPDFQFVPVVFDWEDEELQPDGSWMSEGDGCIYDLQGRKVATKEQVEDGTWRERLAPGIYILNGKKFKK